MRGETISGDERSLTQYEAIKKWLETRKGTIVLPTGFGKTFVGSTIVAKQLEKGTINSALIVVPTINLIKQWKEEFAKWQYDYTKVNFVCIKSAYKLVDYYDIVVIDEIHTSFGPEYSKIYNNIKYNQLLGLTATLPKDLESIDKFCPVVYTKTIQEALDIGAISDFKVINVAVKMNRKDSSRYRMFDSAFNTAKMNLGIIKKQFDEYKDLNIFDVAKLNHTKKTKDPIVKYSKSFWANMSLRKYTCYNAESKIPVILDILAKYPDKKWILFNKSIKYAQTLHELVSNSLLYHSNMHDIERENVLEKFKSSKKILICVDALNAGLNVPDADAAINISGVSTELVGVQQLGRIGRKIEDKIALYFNLYCADTIEESWVKERTKSLNPIWISKI